jgi:hypothetical protein
LKQFRSLVVAASVSVFAVGGLAHADLVGSYTVGSGASMSYLQFEFANSNTYLYEVRYDGALRGNDLFAIVAAAQPSFFSYQVVTFSFGDALFGVTIGTDTNEGFGNPPAYLDYWHYWTRESGASAWTSSMIGFGDRTVSNGSWDGWVFNSDAPPAAVPTPAAGLALIAGSLLTRRRR